MTLIFQTKNGGTWRAVRGVLVAGMALAVLAGCGRWEPEGPAGPTVVATTTMIADLANVIAGEDAHVIGLMRSGEDPHIYDVKPRDAQAIANADLVLGNGLNLEATLYDVVANNASGDVVWLAERAGIEAIRSTTLSGAPDPHCWMDVDLFRRYAQVARNALIRMDPEHEAGYQRRAEAYIEQLSELDAWVHEQLERIPQRRRVIVTSHDAFNYFGRAYDVEVHGVIGISTAQQPRPQDIMALEQLVVDRDIQALFIETSVAPTLNDIVKKVARETGVAIGGSLYSDSLAAPDDPAGTYVGMIRHNVNTIVEALR